MDVDFTQVSQNLPDFEQFPETPLVTKLRMDKSLIRTGFPVDLPLLLDPDETGSRGRPFARGILTELFWNEAEKKIVGAIHFSHNCEGPANAVHGGAIATGLDSCLGFMALRHLGFGAVTLNLNVNYRKFIPLGSVVKVECYVVKSEDKKAHLEGKLISADGTVHSEATAVFYRILPRKNDYMDLVKQIGPGSGTTKEDILTYLKKQKEKQAKAKL